MNFSYPIVYLIHTHKCQNICIRSRNNLKVYICIKILDRDILKMSKLCDSLGGLEVPLLIIH
jgi:hypothetical protein